MGASQKERVKNINELELLQSINSYGKIAKVT